MKFLMILSLATIMTAQAQAADIQIGGKSAERLYRELNRRSENVTKSNSKSMLGSAVTNLDLHGDVLRCSVKDGWVLTSYKCRLPGTNHEDLVGVRVIDMNTTGTSGDPVIDAINDLGDAARAANYQNSLKLTGASARNLFKSLDRLSDKTLQKASGVTKFLKKKYRKVSIDEIECYETENKVQILNTHSYKCVIPAAVAEDANLPTQVIDTTPTALPGVGS